MLKTVLAGCFDANGYYYFTYFNVPSRKQIYPAESSFKTYYYELSVESG